MTNRFSKWQLLLLSAILGVIAYCTLTFVSITYFPGPFGPLDNYLSQLGNSSLNPDGAVFYNLAVILVGLFTIPFYIALYKIYMKPDRSNLIAVAVLCGLINGPSIMLSGIFSEDFYTQHFFWSLMIFITLIPILFLMNIALMKHTESLKWVSFFGLALAIFNTIFVGYVILIGTDTGAILEWVTVFSYNIWAVILVINTLSKNDS